jgi:hypothetical protein
MKSEEQYPIILWLNYGYEGWQPYGFNTIKEALEAEKYSTNCVITRRVTYEVTETTQEETPTPHD